MKTSCCVFEKCRKKFLSRGRRRYCSDACKMKAYRNRNRYDNSKNSQVALHSSDSHEWYTPKKYIEAVRSVLGNIDIDPASNEIANQTVQATTFYSVSDDGLSKNWQGSVFLNPPYGKTNGKSNQGVWVKKLIDQYEAGICKQAIVLVNASTHTRWFSKLWKYPICFTNHKIRFYSYNHTINQPTHGNAFIYFGSHVPVFKECFTKFGKVICV